MPLSPSGGWSRRWNPRPRRQCAVPLLEVVGQGGRQCGVTGRRRLSGHAGGGALGVWWRRTASRRGGQRGAARCGSREGGGVGGDPTPPGGCAHHHTRGKQTLRAASTSGGGGVNSGGDGWEHVRPSVGRSQRNSGLACLLLFVIHGHSVTGPPLWAIAGWRRLAGVVRGKVRRQATGVAGGGWQTVSGRGGGRWATRFAGGHVVGMASAPQICRRPIAIVVNVAVPPAAAAVGPRRHASAPCCRRPWRRSLPAPSPPTVRRGWGRAPPVSRGRVARPAGQPQPCGQASWPAWPPTAGAYSTSRRAVLVPI